MHNGNGHGVGHGNSNGNGNGKRWLLICLLILGCFWLVSDSYRDGYRDALVQTGETPNARFYRGGPDFPWELVILGGIGYIAWRKGAFDRFGGPGGPFAPGGGNGERGVQRYGGPSQGAAPVFRGPRALFEEWHRESHEAERARSAAPPAPQAPPPAPQASAAEASGDGMPGGGYTPTPPPPPPAPDYWASMTRAADAPGDAGNGSAPVTAPPAAPAASNAEADGPRGATGGPALERW